MAPVPPGNLDVVKSTAITFPVPGNGPFRSLEYAEPQLVPNIGGKMRILSFVGSLLRGCGISGAE